MAVQRKHPNFHLNHDETEVFSAAFPPYVFCITDKRILIRDARRNVSSTSRGCCGGCCCCCGVASVTHEREELLVYLLDDLKDVQTKMISSKGVKGCCPGEHHNTQFSLVLYFTKDVGVYHLPTKEWSFAEENKTSWCKTEPFVSSGDMALAWGLRRVLDEAVFRNQMRDAAKAEMATTRVLANCAAT